jgi:hypothetical protein
MTNVRKAWFVRNIKTGERVYLEEEQSLQQFLEMRFGEDIVNWQLCILEVGDTQTKVEHSKQNFNIIETKKAA